jgi:hypothetical protein
MPSSKLRITADYADVANDEIFEGSIDIRRANCIRIQFSGKFSWALQLTGTEDAYHRRNSTKKGKT